MSYERKPFLNVGCGTIILPGPQPNHHLMVDAAIYSDEAWVNADRNMNPGVDVIFDAFRYPWPFADDSFDGALLAHIVEHIPHEICLADDSERAKELALAQDGWYAFMAELYRVLRPGAIAHILCPYGWSQGAITDPTHTRLITQHTFTHSLGEPEDGAPFTYNNLGVRYELVDSPKYRLTELFDHLKVREDDSPDLANAKSSQLVFEMQTRVNVAYEIYGQLRKVG